MKKQLLLIGCLIWMLDFSFAQTAPAIEWQKCLGGTNTDHPTWIRQTNDSGYILSGWSHSNDGDVSGHHGSSDSMDLWIVKIDSLGSIQWQNSFGGSKNEWGGSAIQTNDSGYLISAPSRSNDGDVSGNHGGYDAWIVKTDNSGNIQWQNSFGGSIDEVSKGVPIQTNDDGYIITTGSNSNNGNVSGNHGGQDIWVFKIDRVGNLQWQKCFGGSNDEFVTAFFRSYDGNYVIIGTTYSSDGDIVINHGVADYWLLKIDTIGNIIWEKTFGGINSENSYGGIQTNDNGFMVVGWKSDTTNCIYQPFSGWLVKTDSVGNIQWEKCYGGSSPTDLITSIKQLNNDDYVMTGITGSNDGDVSGLHGSDMDAWLVRIDSFGNIIWQKCLGGSFAETSVSLELTYDQSYIFTGYTESNDGDVTGYHGGRDYWVVKLASDSITGIIHHPNQTSNLQIFPNPFTTTLTLKGTTQKGELVIFDVTGKEILKQKTLSAETKINTAQLTPGFYFIKYWEEIKIVNMKVVKAP